MRKIIFILALLSLLILGFLGISFGVNKAPAFWLDSKIEINKYYFGKIDEATYWFQFTKTDKDLAEGNYFIL
ncbi:MAG: hypothetical protein M0Q45_09235, partial [Bacteroidales bacterium]|nr:hypothetical protein [Bacteroidales bacterium]